MPTATGPQEVPLPRPGGYLRTALWAGLVLAAPGARFGAGVRRAWRGSDRPHPYGGFLAVALQLVDLANFAGYVLWSAWLLIFAAVLVRRTARLPSRP